MKTLCISLFTAFFFFVEAEIIVAQKSEVVDIADYGIIVEPLPSLTDEKAALCVINTYDEGVHWFVLGGGMNERLDGIEAALYTVDDIKASSNGKYAAVLSVGEGHPMLEVIDLRKLREQQTYTVLHTVNPYPGIIRIEGWQGSELHIASDMLLTQRDPETGDVMDDVMFASNEVFALNVITGTIVGVSEGAKNPAKHYANVLLNPQAGDSDKEVALSGLLHLETINLTVDELMKILDLEQNSERVLKLIDVIQKVRQQEAQ